MLTFGSLPLLHSHGIKAQTLHEGKLHGKSSILIIYSTVTTDFEDCKGKGLGGLLAFLSENYCWLQ